MYGMIMVLGQVLNYTTSRTFKAANIVGNQFALHD